MQRKQIIEIFSVWFLKERKRQKNNIDNLNCNKRTKVASRFETNEISLILNTKKFM